MSRALIRGTAAETTVYVDTLGDMTLGTAGATLASLFVAAVLGRRAAAGRHERSLSG